jgi:hypothetical protein
MLDSLSKSIEENKDLIGPIEGRAKSFNPYDTKAQSFQSQVNATKQIVGKYLEEGVLRLEDEKKYERILPKISDTPEVAREKLANVRKLIDEKYKSQTETLGRAGYDITDLAQQETPNQIPGKEPLKPVHLKTPEEAKMWLEQNPNDPRADQVRQKLGIAGVKTEQPGLNPAQPGVIKEEKPLAKKIGDFLGISKFGEGIGTAMFLKSKEGQKLQDDAAKGDKYAIEALNQILEDAPNAKELIGSSAMTVLNVASAGTAKGVMAGKAGLAAKVGIGTGTGYAFDVASNLQEEDKSVGESFKPGVGTVVGGAIPIAGKIAGKTVSGIKEFMRKGQIDDISGKIAPNLTKKEIMTALSEGRVVRTGKIGKILGKADKVLLDKKVTAAAETIQRVIPKASKLSDAEIANKAGEAIGNISNKLSPELKNVKINDELKEGIINSWASVKESQVEKLAFASKTALNKQHKAFEKTLENLIDADNADELWKSIQKYDDSIPSQIKKANGMSSDVAQELRGVWLDNRRILRNAIDELALEMKDEIVSQGFRDMANLYTAKTNIINSANLAKNKGLFKKLLTAGALGAGGTAGFKFFAD